MHLKSNNLIANDASNILLMKVCLSYWLANYDELHDFQIDILYYIL